MASSGSILVAAIDFGTTYSGAALSFRHDFEKDQAKIYALKIGNPRVSMKCMTCILIKPDGRTFHSFGEEADTYYYEELSSTERKKWYFFKRFKMELYDLGNTQPASFQLNGGYGQRLPALTVFSLSIQYLKDQILEHCNKTLTGSAVRDDEITWVLTVPAIWNDKAKGFMREAAVKAGISTEKLVIALEPEVASIYCQHIPIMKDQTEIAKLVPFQPGNKYVVLDCGGGTVDITVHKVVKGNTGTTIKEIHKARGNDMGGTKVDKAFIKFLTDLVGDSVFKVYKDDEDEDFWELLNAFEEKKRNVKEDGPKLTVNTKLVEIFKKVRKMSLQNHLNEIRNTDVSITAYKLRIENSAAKAFFRDSIKSIIGELQAIFARPDTSDCTAILMVGGYSESPLLQHRIKEEFPSKDVICPNEAGLAVLKGAVIFGHNPAAISQRVSKYTYGIKLHSGEFSKLVEIDELLVVGEAQQTKTYAPSTPDATAVSINIYTSPEANPRMVADRFCRHIGSFTLPMPDTTGGKSRTLTARMLFGGTEFVVEAKDGNTGIVKTLRVGWWD